MKSSNSARRRVTRVLCITVAAGLLSELLSSLTASAQAAPTSTQAAPAQTAPQASSQPSPAMSQEDWQATMSRVPVPKKGCFTSAYPSIEWREVPCTTTPSYPQVPANGPRTQDVGNGTDYVAIDTATGNISSAVGSFDSVTGVTSESGPIGNAGPSVANAYTLQLNTDRFTTTACARTPPNPPDPNCVGWQQFVFENTCASTVDSAGNCQNNNYVARGYIQYWLISYNANCPAGQNWNQVSFPWLGNPSAIHCWKNNSMGSCSLMTPAGLPAPQPITNLGQLSLTGRVSATSDSVMVIAGGGIACTMVGDNGVNAITGWRIAEFNVFGDGGDNNGKGGQASFNSGSTIVVRVSLDAGSKMAPTCPTDPKQQGFTAETNNLNLVGTPAMVMAGVLPAIVFTESNDLGKPASCAASPGDTHLMTADGLLYDFQASGDFLLVQADRNELRAWGDPPLKNFVVQTRQVSGAPMWPNASVNKAVATRMGGTSVAVCLAPTRLLINGNIDQLDDGESLALPGGVSVTRIENAYDVRRPGGDIVRAEVNDGWIDVFVGVALGSNVRGLLGNFNGDTADDIAKRDGTVLAQPVSFADLYQRYGESWRVPLHESLLSVCGDRKIERGIPEKPFYANNLDHDQYNRAREICTAVGVEDEALLDACTLDVAVLGNETAASVFIHAPTPIAVMQACLDPNVCP